MAWKVYGHMNSPGYSRDAGGEVYGPLPRKRWVRDIPHRRHKPAYRFHYSQRGAGTADDYNESRAIEYARWLARRDGLIIPVPHNTKARCDWSGFYSETKTRNVHHWNGSKPQATYCKRIRAVEWGVESKEEVYNTRKDGRRGAWSHNITHFEVTLRVDIPHWNFEPTEAVEEFDAPALPPLPY